MRWRLGDMAERATKILKAVAPLQFSRQGDLSQSVSVGLAGIQRALSCGVGADVVTCIRLSAR